MAWSRSFTNCMIAWSTFSVEAGADVAAAVGVVVAFSGVVLHAEANIITTAIDITNKYRLIVELLSVWIGCSIYARLWRMPEASPVENTQRRASVDAHFKQ